MQGPARPICEIALAKQSPLNPMIGGDYEHCRKEEIRQHRRQVGALPTSMSHTKTLRARSIVDPHSCSRAVVKLLDDRKHLEGASDLLDHRPQKFSPNRVVGFREVDKVDLQWGCLFHAQVRGGVAPQTSSRRLSGSVETHSALARSSCPAGWRPA